jgi:hypothetical protein
MPPIPPEQLERIQIIRGAHLDAIDEALDTVDEAIAADARRTMARIRKSGYNPGVIRRETRRLARRNNDRVRQAVAQQVQHAALLGERVGEVITAFSIAERLKGPDVPVFVPPSAVKRAQELGSVGSEAALTRVSLARLRTPMEVSEALRKHGGNAGKIPIRGSGPGVTQLRTFRKAGQIKDASEIGLSARLHGSAAKNVASTEKAVNNIIRAGTNYDKAQKDLIREVADAGETLGARQRIPAHIKRLEKAGRELRILETGPKSAYNREQYDRTKREWDRAIKAIERKALQQVDKRGGTRELLQIVQKQGTKGLDKALQRWTDEKQRYNADRIVSTESSAAYRAREYNGVKDKKYVTGAYWRLNRGARRKYVKRVKPRKKSKKGMAGMRCVCEGLADQLYPKAVIKDYPRMGHPYCNCFWEYVYDREKMFSEPLTEADVEWYRNLPD